MDKEIKKGFHKVEKTAKKQEKKLVKMDIKRDAKCEAALHKKKQK
jgi:hypothetical protein